jgi:hypothetical protein
MPTGKNKLKNVPKSKPKVDVKKSNSKTSSNVKNRVRNKSGSRISKERKIDPKVWRIIGFLLILFLYF